MSELTKEYIGKEFGIGDPTKADPDWPRDPEAVCVIETGEYLLPDECAVIMNAMARELLSLRSLRDAGDEEVEKSIKAIRGHIRIDTDCIAMNTLIDGYRVRDRQLREAREEIERLKGESQKNFMAFTQSAMTSGVKEEFSDQEIQSLQSKIATLTAEKKEDMEAIACLSSDVERLTAERDEARSELEDAQRQEIETIAAVINHRKLIDEQKQKIDFLTAELAALKSCPSMAEIDALSYWPDHEFKSQQYSKIQQLADIARRSIVAWNEVVGLLKKCLRYSLSMPDVATVVEGVRSNLRLSNLSQGEANRILEIVEGK